MNIGIIGRTHLLIATAKLLAQAGHKIVFIYTCKAEQCHQATEGDFEHLATELGCPFFLNLDVYSSIEALNRLNVDVCVSINWPSILRKPFLDLFEFGVINAHVGDLPRYKGNACPNWAILNFESQIGLTIHKMTEELDSGAYLTKAYFPIDENTYITDVYSWLDEAVPRAFLDGLGKLRSAGFVEQDKEIRTLRTYPRQPEDSKISWNEKSRNILAVIRASSRPFEGAFCFLNSKNQKLIVYRARHRSVDFDYFAVPGQVCFGVDGNPVVATGDGLIEIEECALADIEEMDAKKTILRSLRNRLT